MMYVKALPLNGQEEDSMIEMLQSKIHRATVTDANINYEGSITLPSYLIKMAGLREFQKVLVVDINNGQRFETYVIETPDKNVFCINGAAARLVSVGDKIIVMSFCFANERDIDENYEPKIIIMDDNNEVVA